MVRLSHCFLFVFMLIFPAFYCRSQETILVPRSDGAQVPLRVFSAHAKGCAPLAVLSPGAGGNENGLAYLARGLEAQGWTAVVLGHRESGPQVLRRDIVDSGIRGGLLKLTTDSNAYRARFMDIDAALAWSDRQCRAPFRVLLGHSMGAATVMLEAGAKNKLDLHGRDAFQAYVALSPEGPGSIFPEHAWSGIRKPVLVLTGTRDRALEGGWQSREIPFQQMPAGCKWLGVIDGATHMQLGGGAASDRVEEVVLQATFAFLEDVLHNSCAAPANKPAFIQVK